LDFQAIVYCWALKKSEEHIQLCEEKLKRIELLKERVNTRFDRLFFSW